MIFSLDISIAIWRDSTYKAVGAMYSIAEDVNACWAICWCNILYIAEFSRRCTIVV